MKEKRPINLNLLTISFPVTAIVSILHRLSGLFLMVFIPCLLKLLDLSLSSEANFLLAQSYLQQFLAKVLLFLVLLGFTYHLLAGIRHLLMEFMGLGESKQAARCVAWSLLLITFISAIYLWMWLFKGAV